MSTCAIPVIDRDVKYVGVSKLRDLNASKLKDSQGTTYVFQENDQPLAVLLSYEKYMFIQQQLELAQVANALEMITDENERNGFLAGITDLQEGRVRPVAEVRATLKNRYGSVADEDK